MLAVGFSRGGPTPSDARNIVSFNSSPRLAAPVPEAWFLGSVTPVVPGGVTASPCGQGDQAKNIPRVANSDYTRQSATIQHVPQSSAATTAEMAHYMSAQTMAVMLAMAQSTERLVEATQQWIQR